jgi:hypothetical protein
MKSDVFLNVRFKLPSEGGRMASLEGQSYGCPLVVDGEAFDCRLMLAGQKLELGKTYEIPVKFLNPDLALPKLSIGKAITLWEGKEIASGQVLRF